MAITCLPDQAINICGSEEYNCTNTGGHFSQRVVHDETIEFEVYTSEITGNLLSDQDTQFFPIVGGDGETTSVNATQLIDSGANFTGLGLDDGFTIKNGSTNLQCFGNSAGTTATTINTYIGQPSAPTTAMSYFPAIGNEYLLLNWLTYHTSTNAAPIWLTSSLNGQWGIMFYEDDQVLEKVDFTSSGTVYKVVLTIKDYVEGNFVNIDFDNYTLDEDGNRVIEYSFLSDATGDFTLTTENDASFILKDIAIYELSRVEMEIRDKGDNTIYANSNATNNGDPASPITYYGNYVKFSINFDDLNIDEGCYRIIVVDESDSLAVGTTDFLQVGQWDCNIKLQWTNDHNIGGLGYVATEYTQTMWVKGELKNSSFGLNQETTLGSTGITTLLTARRETIKQLIVADMPEHMHRALAFGIIHHTFTINGDQYVAVSDAYEPIWRRSSTNAPSVTEFILKQENKKNQLC
jgi:hypothetical protein